MSKPEALRDFPYLRFLPVLCIGILLVFTFRLYGFAYFWLDDFTNLYWVQPQSLGQMVGHVLNPASSFFRPVGMFLYWVALHVFDRNAAGYHWLLWGIHSLNVGLVYCILKRFTSSRSAAAVGATLFASQAAFSDLYFSFGTIFEVAGAALYFAGILVWCRESRSAFDVLLATAMFLFALKAKEMAITLPAVWLGCDVLVHSKRLGTIVKHLVPPALVGGWYGLQKLSEMQASRPDDPYYLDPTSLTLGRGFGSYFNRLFLTDFRWQVWAITFVFLLLCFLLGKKKLAFFFQAYVFVSFLPVIFLPNHREYFYWYFPMLGICGLAALLARWLQSHSARYFPQATLAPAAALSLILLCSGSYILTRDLTSERRLWQAANAKEYRAFVEGMQSLPPPLPGETLFFSSKPDLFTDDMILYATQVALRRTDITTKVVDVFPSEAKYRLRFENSRIVVDPGIR